MFILIKLLFNIGEKDDLSIQLFELNKKTVLFYSFPRYKRTKKKVFLQYLSLNENLLLKSFK